MQKKFSGKSMKGEQLLRRERMMKNKKNNSNNNIVKFKKKCSKILGKNMYIYI